MLGVVQSRWNVDTIYFHYGKAFNILLQTMICSFITLVIFLGVWALYIFDATILTVILTIILTINYSYYSFIILNKIKMITLIYVYVYINAWKNTARKFYVFFQKKISWFRKLFKVPFFYL